MCDNVIVLSDIQKYQFVLQVTLPIKLREERKLQQLRVQVDFKGWQQTHTKVYKEEIQRNVVNLESNRFQEMSSVVSVQLKSEKKKTKMPIAQEDTHL